MKKNIILVLITAIICISGTVLATNISADQIQYDENTTVKDKLDDLYDKANREPQFGTALYSNSSGDQLASRTGSLNLTKGKYIVLVGLVSAYLQSTTESKTISGVPLTCSNDCTTQKISSYGVAQTSSAKSADSNYSKLGVQTSIYYVKLNSNSGTVSYTYNTDAYNTVANSIIIHAIPIS